MRRLRYLVTGAQALGVVCLAAVSLATGGCGPVEYLSQVSDKATRAVAAAKDAHAAELAPYEYTAATEYLHKAKEEGGTAEYEAAIEYGRRAEDLAIRARVIAEEKNGARLGGRVGAGVEPSARAGDSP